MPLSVRVWTLPDINLARCIHPDLNRLVEFAQSLKLPMLGNVDSANIVHLVFVREFALNTDRLTV